MMDIESILTHAVLQKASDVHLSAGAPAVYRVDGKLQKGAGKTLSAAQIAKGLESILTPQQWRSLVERKEVDSACVVASQRFRLNAFYQKDTCAAVFRTIPSRIPDLQSLGVPAKARELSAQRSGLLLVTGPAGCGKSTTLAALVEHISRTSPRHIITIEDPMEFCHQHGLGLVNQREVGRDTDSFASALRAALRQDPDVLLVGEMRDPYTIQTVLTAAETGHLVLSSVHTKSAAKTIDRIVDVFSAHQQNQIRSQLALVLEGIFSQQLVPLQSGSGRIAAFETLVATPAVRHLIREGKTHQIPNLLQTGRAYAMQTMDQSLMALYQQGRISEESLHAYALDPSIIPSAFFQSVPKPPI